MKAQAGDKLRRAGEMVRKANGAMNQASEAVLAMAELVTAGIPDAPVRERLQTNLHDWAFENPEQFRVTLAQIPVPPARKQAWSQSEAWMDGRVLRKPGQAEAAPLDRLATDAGSQPDHGRMDGCPGVYRCHEETLEANENPNSRRRRNGRRAARELATHRGPGDGPTVKTHLDQLRAVQPPQSSEL